MYMKSCRCRITVLYNTRLAAAALSVGELIIIGVDGLRLRTGYRKIDVE